MLYFVRKQVVNKVLGIFPIFLVTTGYFLYKIATGIF